MSHVLRRLFMLCAVPGSSFAQGRSADHHMPLMANRVASPPAVARPRAAHGIGRYSMYDAMPVISSHQTCQTLLCKAICAAPLPLHRRSNWYARSFSRIREPFVILRSIFTLYVAYQSCEAAQPVCFGRTKVRISATCCRETSVMLQWIFVLI